MKHVRAGSRSAGGPRSPSRWVSGCHRGCGGAGSVAAAAQAEPGPADAVNPSAPFNRLRGPGPCTSPAAAAHGMHSLRGGVCVSGCSYYI